MKPGDAFVRTRTSQGLPYDYEPHPHHIAGYTGIVEKMTRYGIIDTNGHKHGILNIRERSSEEA